MNTPATMQSRVVIVATKELIRAFAHYGLPLMNHWENIQHDFTLRGKTAGQFKFNRRDRKVLILRWNVEAMTKYPDEYLKETIPHEVAHLVVWVLRLEGKIAYYDHHGYNWHRVMCFLGAPAIRTHKYQLTHARERRQLS